MAKDRIKTIAIGIVIVILVVSIVIFLYSRGNKKKKKTVEGFKDNPGEISDPLESFKEYQDVKFSGGLEKFRKQQNADILKLIRGPQEISRKILFTEIPLSSVTNREKILNKRAELKAVPPGGSGSSDIVFSDEDVLHSEKVPTRTTLVSSRVLELIQSSSGVPHLLQQITLDFGDMITNKFNISIGESKKDRSVKKILKKIKEETKEQTLIHITNVTGKRLDQLKRTEMEMFEYHFSPKYSNEIITAVAIMVFSFFNNVSKDEVSEDGKLLLLNMARFIVNKSLNEEEVEKTYSSIISIAKDESNPIVKANAVDILSLSNNKRYQEMVPELLERVRRSEERKERPIPLFRGSPEAPIGTASARSLPATVPLHRAPMVRRGTERIWANPLINNDLTMGDVLLEFDLLAIMTMEEEHERKKVNKKKTVYEDSQNVHTKEINEGVLDTAKRIIDLYPSTGLQPVLSIAHLNKEKKERVEKSIFRIKTDPSSFKYGMTLNKIYESILECINHSDNKNDKEEMEKRLIEELDEMYNQCTTGHLSRLINSLSGFAIGEKVGGIKISIVDEVYSSLANHLNKVLAESTDPDLMDGMDLKSKHRRRYLSFLMKSVSSKKKEMDKEYNKNTTEEVVISLNRYVDSSKTNPEFKVSRLGQVSID